MNTFKFQLWSDLRLEMCEMKFPTGYVSHAPNLILAGNIGVLGSTLYCDLLQKVAQEHDNVFVIAGEQEYTGSSRQSAEAALQTICTDAGPNIVYLNNAVHDVPSLGCRLVGTTLWSDTQDDVACSAWVHSKNTSGQALTLGFLQQEIARAVNDGVRLVVITHDAPLTFGHEQTGNTVYTFQTDFSELMGPPVAVWCCGNTHHCESQLIKRTHVVSNQRMCVKNNEVIEDSKFQLTRVFEA